MDMCASDVEEQGDEFFGWEAVDSMDSRDLCCDPVLSSGPGMQRL